ncbi:transport and Golgi organization protein 2 isoform X1 [Drosophila guanche]|uniref:Blast:RRP12-like protein n=1 Tax=Drosophila guanche TaxID=7266 RepID=A0A3B0KMY7_DROGU|nr:transport and Golgi organization protein 2 isoform X1 [Drosophila guanche]SPP86501.1 blast:RRP12-like protein [Drosophila guanche]
MCVIFFYTNSNPQTGGYRLILASNRDEFFARKTVAATEWPNADHVVGGIDLEPGREGGTWLAIGSDSASASASGVFKVGALLNLTGEPKPRDAVAHKNILQPNNQNNNHNSSSCHSCPTKRHENNEHFLLGRGTIVADFVSQFDEPTNSLNFNQSLLQDCTKYSAFNFVSIEIGPRSVPAQIRLLSNVPPTLNEFEEGKCYGFGNSLPGTPFEKVRFGQQQFAHIVEQHGADSAETLSAQLLQLLKNKTKFWPDAELQRRAPNWGEELSALNVHIVDRGYGSRTHSIILVDANNQMHFFEENFEPEMNPQELWNPVTVVHKHLGGKLV